MAAGSEQGARFEEERAAESNEDAKDADGIEAPRRSAGRGSQLRCAPAATVQVELVTGPDFRLGDDARLVDAAVRILKRDQRFHRSDVRQKVRST